ncbi:hypothetical protein BDV23DRAFT_183285 [Aspergillus alliaceus]|uniref:Uncharacterized protein n=1 Tax=Petromyces alliaceus TaxID=209559 RepID=A0A5N6FIK1_PETAA|nr:uncharacterized protein BDW43DRAFT_315843 [Aspergillus alliaceus]KAB8228473.1 hypothetical protein BDW43DRAFT_315843 [Aspergillus alliaceus]KAE8390569.1 hypothetical protein BDV23DRAFT_183285 [Aspergillus alliaceus]
MARITLSFYVICVCLALMGSALPAKRAEPESSGNTISPSVAAELAYESLKSATAATRNINKEFSDDDEKPHQINFAPVPPKPSSSGTPTKSLKDLSQENAAEKVHASREPDLEPKPQTDTKVEEPKTEVQAKDPKGEAKAKEEPTDETTEEEPVASSTPTPTVPQAASSSSAAKPAKSSNIVKDDPLAKIPVVGPLLSGGGLKGTGLL